MGQLAAEGQLGSRVPITQKAVMSDALKILVKHVKQEAADELTRLQGHLY
jgi:hypothetical protein